MTLFQFTSLPVQGGRLLSQGGSCQTGAGEWSPCLCRDDGGKSCCSRGGEVTMLSLHVVLPVFFFIFTFVAFVFFLLLVEYSTEKLFCRLIDLTLSTMFLLHVVSQISQLSRFIMTPVTFVKLGLRWRSWRFGGLGRTVSHHAPLPTNSPDSPTTTTNA